MGWGTRAWALLLLAVLAAFPVAAGAADPAPAPLRATVSSQPPPSFQVPVPSLAPVPAQPPASVQVPLAPQAIARPSLVAPASEKAADTVLAPGEVDRQVGVHRADDIDEGEKDDFFATASAEVEKGKDGVFAGLSNPIDKFIYYFTNRGRERFGRYLARSGKYREMMQGILVKYGLPEDLIYLALIESGFSPKAYSHAKAAGPWQFIAGTGRRYGLRIDWWADERRDAEKSTHAAASYLKDLHGMFDSWPLAAAAYNAGEGKISRAVDRYNTEDFAELIRHGYLAQETKDYVPKMLAALTIAKEPEKYGFDDIEYEEPLDLRTVVVPGGIDLAETARILDVTYDEIRDWNPELRRFCTPPNRDRYELRLSAEAAAVAAERMDEIRTQAKVTFLRHDVRRRETIDGLASKYNISPAVLRELNGLKGDSLRRVSRLVVPVTGLSGEEAVPGKAIDPEQLSMAHMRVEEGRRKAARYRSSSAAARGKSIRVRRGETLAGIARKHGVSVSALADANGLSRGARVKAGTSLVVPGKGAKASSAAKASRNGKKTVRCSGKRGTARNKASGRTASARRP